MNIAVFSERHGSVVVSTGTGLVITSRCKNLALNISLSEETLKAVDPFYLVSMPGEVSMSWTPHSSLEKDNYLNHSCVSLKMGCL